MKKLIVLILLALLFTASQVWSQGASLTVFSANGEKFTLEVGGDSQNAKPEARVYTEHLGGMMIKMKVFPEDVSIPPVSKSVMNKPNGTFIYVLQKDAKGKYTLQSTDTDWSSEVKTGKETEKEAEATPPKKTEKKKSAQVEKEVPAEKGDRCKSPMTDPDFYASLAMLSNAPFDGSKLSNAKNMAKKNCLTSTQVRDVVHVFDYEKSKLEFAKFAYELVYDPANYDNVNDALRSSSVTELKRYIDSKGK